MKKLLLSLGLFSALTVNAQLTPNSTAANFTIAAHQPWLATEGLNNDGTYTLYDYLDLGYTVILDLSATWCGPCYSYHNQHALDQLWESHGVAGFPGVNATTQDKVLVLWVDVDGATADPTMLDGAGNIGNWLNTSAAVGVMPATGTSGNVMFPMANPATALANSIANDYDISYYPTIYRISPNRLVTEIGTLSYNGLVNSLGVTANHGVNDGDAMVLSYLGQTNICNEGISYTPSARIYNSGSTALSNVTVNFKRNGQVVSSATVGSLAAFTGTNVTGSVINSFSQGAIETEVVVDTDVVSANNTLSATISSPVSVSTSSVNVNITTDRYASETSWEIRNLDNNQVVASVAQGAWTNLTANGQTVRDAVTVNLQANTCYAFTIRDSYDDGICCSYGNGSFNVKDASNNTIIAFQDFGSSYTKLFRTTADMSIEGVNIDALVNIYPNPATDRINVAFEGKGMDYSISLIDLQGREVYSNTISSIEGAHTVAIPTDGLSTGSYMVKLNNGTSVVTKNVVIK